MTLNKGIFINKIKEGDPVEGIFLVKELNQGETKSGKPFLRLTLLDNSGEIDGPIWDNVETLAPLCQSGCFVWVSGRGESYRGGAQLRINRVTAVNASEIDLADFMPTSKADLQKLEDELDGLIAGIKNRQLRCLLDSIFQDTPKIRAQFTTAPAAKAMHHAYLGGLLEHTVAVAKLATAISGLYPAIDHDLLLAGALLHDLGKIEELSYESYPFGYSSRGRLVGHLVIGTETIREKAALIPDFPPDLLNRLQHLILSHHGRHEFGSPVLPMIQEAFVLNFIDDLDAKINYFAKLSRQAVEPGYQWSEYQRNLERFLYFRDHNFAELKAPAVVVAASPPTPTAETPNQEKARQEKQKEEQRDEQGAPRLASIRPKKSDQVAVNEKTLPPHPRQKGLWSKPVKS